MSGLRQTENPLTLLAQRALERDNELAQLRAERWRAEGPTPRLSTWQLPDAAPEAATADAMRAYEVAARSRLGERSLGAELPEERDARLAEAARRIGQASARGLRSWVPDLLAFPADILDAGAYAAHKVAAGQSERSVPSLGAGEAVRRAMTRTQRPAAAQAEWSDPEAEARGAEGVEGALQALNPLFFTNPAKLAQLARTPMGMAALSVLAGAHGTPMGGALGVIKPRGGQWLSGSTDAALKGFKVSTPELDFQRPVSQELGNYIRRSFPEAEQAYNDAFRASGAHSMDYAKNHLPWLQANRPDVIEALQKGNTPDAALNRWIDTTLKKYIERDMATPEDPVRALAERGVLHTEDVYAPVYAAKQRREMSAAGKKMSRDILASVWEDATDLAIKESPASSFISKSSPDWLRKLAPDTPIYKMATPNVGFDVGFGHLLDELHNALRADSDLPRELQLRPESLQRMSMAQAVERVAKINAWREEQIAKASAERANNAAVHLFKEYPDTPELPNPKGLRWVELKAPKDEQFSDDVLRKAMQDRDMLPEEIESALADPQVRAEIAQQARADVGALKDALKYEGDAMGHCVGGYCEDVAAGQSRIFSLRDAQGEPHVTVEVSPPDVRHDMNSPHTFFDNHASEEFKAAHPWTSELGGAGTINWNRSIVQSPEYQAWLKEQPASIVQIKGKSNKKPNDEYLSFVQDFVRSQKWSGVGDLENAGLRRARDVFNDLEAKTLREHGHEFGDYLSEADIKRLHEVWDSWPKAKAAGGSVQQDGWKAAFSAEPEWKSAFRAGLEAA